jgi:hypothetical protein
LEWNPGCLGGFETAFDGEIEAFIDLMEWTTDIQIPDELTIHSYEHAAIARVGHTEPSPGQGRAMGVLKSVQYWVSHGWHPHIEWVPGHTGIVDGKRPDRSGGKWHFGQNLSQQRSSSVFFCFF